MLAQEHDCELAEVEILKCKCIMISVYRSSNKNSTRFNNFLIIVTDIFNKIYLGSHKIIILGDFNIHFHINMTI